MRKVLALVFAFLAANSAFSSEISADIGPVLDGSAVTGFKFEKIASDSAWARYGLKNDDIVLFINGKPTSQFGTSTVEFVSALQNPKHVEAIIQRDGKRKKLSFNNP